MGPMGKSQYPIDPFSGLQLIEIQLDPRFEKGVFFPIVSQSKYDNTIEPMYVGSLHLWIAMVSQICSTLLLIYFGSAMPWSHGTIFWFIWACPKKMGVSKHHHLSRFKVSSHMIQQNHHTKFSHGNLKDLMVPKWCGPNDHNGTTIYGSWNVLNGPHLQCRGVVNAHMECTAFGQLRSTRQFLGADGHGVTNVLPETIWVEWVEHVDFEPNMENGAI